MLLLQLRNIYITSNKAGYYAVFFKSSDVEYPTLQYECLFASTLLCLLEKYFEITEPELNTVRRFIESVKELTK